MAYTINRAAAAAGRCKSTILRAIHSGKISAVRDPVNGGWLIEPAELHRAYSVAAEPAGGAAVQSAPVPVQSHDEVQHRPAPVPVHARLEAAEVRISEILEAQRLRDDVIADLRQRLDRADEHRQRADEQRQQAQAALAEVQAKLVAVLTDQRPAPAPPARRAWWPRGRKLIGAMLVVACGGPVLAANDGNELLRWCLQPDGTFANGYCLGYISGIDDALEGGAAVCVPEEVTRGQVRDVVVRYLQANQELGKH
jgi:hypothetical protein